MARGTYYGTSKQEEVQKYEEIKKVAQGNVERIKAGVDNLARELHELQEVYDVNEKEGLAQWFIKDNRFREVRQELQRAERANKKPYFGRIDFIDPETDKKATYYIGKSVIYEDPAEPMVIDWRSPVSSVYYEQNLGKCRFLVPGEGAQEILLERKRTYEVDDTGIKDFYDSEVVANDELLTKYLSKSTRNVLSEIIATIQQEQNEVIRINPHHNVLVQGSAGSGKTTVAMHRISYILYNYEREFKPADFYIVGSNKMLLNYITGVLPDLDVYDIGQMTMEELFIRLLYEEWDDKAYSVKKWNKSDMSVGVKGSKKWFSDLEKYCERYLRKFIATDDIVLEQNGHLIMSGEEIESILESMKGRTIYDRYERLTDMLISHLETELFGRGLSYPAEEQKRLYQKYRNYFVRQKPKQTVFELYEQFVAKEALKVEAGALDIEGGAKYSAVSYDRYTPDLYDLACLAYIYKALKETEVIREACHVVIDEAQDFGMSVYRSLKYCLNKCTFTIMGDVSQNINMGCGLGDWEELKKVMLPDPYDYFGLLRKSYRNTIEISKFAGDILRHGTFPIYPVEPIVRHGKEVVIKQCSSTDELTERILEQCSLWEKEYETLALVCADIEETEQLLLKLNNNNKYGIKVSRFDEDNMSIEKGLTVLPIEYAKGLEFDAVIIANASAEVYPREDGYAKLLYVAATRALHELAVFHIGEITGLIGEPIPEERKNITFAEDTFHLKARKQKADERTREEIAADQAKLGDSEKELRAKYGPKRSEAITPVKVKRAPQRVKVKEIVETNAVVKPAVAVNIPDQKDRQPVKEEVQRKSEFGEAPAGASLMPLGHGKIDTAVKWVDVQKDKVLITSFYGILAIVPISDSCVRTLFSRGDIKKVAPVPGKIAADSNVRFKCNQLRDKIEIVMAKLTVSIDKRTGAVAYISSAAGELLSESVKLTRQYNEIQKIWWNYFSFGKKEMIKACSPDGEWTDIISTAKYVSSSEGSNKGVTEIVSMKGYRIIVPRGRKILLNTIPSYSTYIRYENADIIDYFFQTAK